MTIRIMEYDRPVADLDLIGSKLEIRPFGTGNNWVFEMIEDMRGDRSNSELFDSLRERLCGRTWAGYLLH